MEVKKTEGRKTKDVEMAEYGISLMSEWEKAISERNFERAKELAFNILKIGEEFMKSKWNEVRPGERLSDFAKRILNPS